MKKGLPIVLGAALLVSVGLVINHKLQNSNNNIIELRKQHEEFLRNSPFRETLKRTKKERKARGLAPNKYFEREWELTINPSTGKPEPEKIFELQEALKQRALFAKVPGEKTNNWVERGPNNVGGRTRAIMFDPNDVTHKRVFAGGVSGGLWVNNDITDADSSWAEVNIPQNLAISCITSDPNDSMTFYVGTGESYVGGDVNGNGVWKSVNGGVDWVRVFGGTSGDTNIIPGTPNSFNARITVNSPTGIAGDYFGRRASFGASLTPITGNLVIVDDDTPTSSEGCSTLVNGAAINGNIAVIYRGTCEFGQKVLTAENAGALAVIVINNVADDIISMSSGAVGESVTIPSIMISMADGQVLGDNIRSPGVSVSMNGFRNYSGYTAKPGAQHINDIKIRDIGGGNSEIYVAAGSTFYSQASPSVFLGAEDFGLYKSLNNGASWSKLTLLPSSNSNDYQLQPNDIEISADNTVWVSTTNDIFGNGGSEILSSTDGTNFNLKYKVPSGERSQIAVSSTNPSKIYVLAELDSGSTIGVKMVYTDDAFATTTSLPLPNSLDPNIPDGDFTNGQAFYNLVIEVDPTNDVIVYAGGIDVFRSSNSGNTWSQISEYYTVTTLSNVHPDQHAFVFHPTDSNIAILGNDGGVYYATSLSSTPPIISPRNKNYNTLQFYHGAIGQEVNSEKFLAGAQDNGTQFIHNATAGVNESYSPSGGDGTYVFIDKDNQYFITSTQNGNYYYFDYTSRNYIYPIDNSSSGGDFINPAELDDANNYLYTDGSTDSFKINRYKLNSVPGLRVSDSFTSLLLNSSPTAFKSSPFVTTTLFVGTANGRLFRVTNVIGTTPTWTEITGNDFVGSISCIELGATGNDILVTFHNYGVTNVFYSSDAGVTWQNKEGDLPDLPVKAIMRNPLNSNEVILGTELGVWATPNFNDASPSWYQSQNGMKDVKVTSFNLRTADNTVLASTYGRGVFTGLFTADASTLSVNNKTLNDLIKVYPTVSNGNFKVSTNKYINEGYLKVFNINGQEVYSSKVDFSRNSIKNVYIKGSSGIYIVKFTSNGKHSTHKIVIK
jgi:hypothetical protein